MPKTGFFDEYPRFYETGNTPPGIRLNARYDVLIERHLDHIRDRVVLDIGSHDGRWSFAALMAGAKHVTGIEPRAELVEAAKETYREYGIEENRYTFHVGDARDLMTELEPKVDTVLLFGILYHLHYHVELFAALRNTGAETIIVDTKLSPDGEGEFTNSLSLRPNPIDDIQMGAYEIFPGAGFAVVACPSHAEIEFLCRCFEYTLSPITWRPYLEKWGATRPGLRDYASGERGSFLAQRWAEAERARAKVRRGLTRPDERPVGVKRS